MVQRAAEKNTEKNEASASVIFIDDSADLRALTDVLIRGRLGLNCLCMASLRELVGHSSEVLQSRVVIIDVNLGRGQPNGIEAYRWLINHGYRGRIFFLTGHAKSHPMVQKVGNTGVRVFEKPMKADQLLRLVHQAVQGGEVCV